MPRCVHCGESNYKKNGKFGGIQKYKCKSCKRSFSDKPRKFSYDDKERFLNMYLNNVGIRKSALFMGCSPALIVRWIREFAGNLRQQLQKAYMDTDGNIPDVIEMDELYTRVKKGETAFRYGLLIVDGEARLLRMSSEKPKNAL